MKRSVLLLLLFAVSCSTQREEESFIAVTDEFLSELKLMQGDKNAFTPDTYYAPGGVIGIVANGELVVCRPFGYGEASNVEALVNQPADLIDPALGQPVRQDSLFRLGSTSKLFVGLALALCKDQGLVDYEAPVSNYIDDLRKKEVGKLTLKQLFTHTGGLPLLHKPGLRERDDEVTQATMAEIVENAATLSPDSSKIDQYAYSNVGILLLAEVVSRVQELPYEAFIQVEILNPLEMHHTWFHTRDIDLKLKTTGYFPHFQPAVDPDLQGYAPVGGMYSTGQDMAKLMGLFQLAVDESHSASLPINASVIRDLASVYFQEGQHRMGVSVDIGYRDGHTMIGHNGRIDGYASFFTFSREAKTGLVFMANGGFPLGRTTAPALFEKILESMEANRMAD
ncbi:MAG: serine hydrolase [Verrucomicrobia bacterium]|nr:serine hydrolase [Verrucomicrobiota bacterium]MDA1067557.1 serine hydrolase [Verrucomicrobiota bacterium]